MTKLKQIGLYLLLIVLSFFVANFFVALLWGSGIEIDSSLTIVAMVIIAAIIYGIYLVINLILNKILPAHIYKENKIVKLLTFFLVYVIGWTASPLMVLFYVAMRYGGI